MEKAPTYSFSLKYSSILKSIFLTINFSFNKVLMSIIFSKIVYSPNIIKTIPIYNNISPHTYVFILTN